MKHASLVHLVVGLALVTAVACADSEVTSGPAAEAAEERALTDDVAAAERVRANLTALRARNGRSPAGTFVVAEPLLRRARVRILAGRPPDQVLEDQLQLAANNGERDIGYWSIEVTSPDDVRFPAKLVRSRRMNVAIVVVRPPSHSGKPSMLVLFAMAEPDQSN
jgi:hypothetical protein